MEKLYKDTAKAKTNLDQDVKALDGTLSREMQENYQNKMTLDKKSQIGDLQKARLDRDTKDNDKFKKDKADELQSIQDGRNQAEAEYKGKEDLQALITEMEKWKKEIEEMHVTLGSLQIQIKMREDGTEMLQEKRELLDEQKKQKEEENEDLDKQWRAKEEAAKKRLIAKLQRDKNPEVKELIAKEEE